MIAEQPRPDDAQPAADGTATSPAPAPAPAVATAGRSGSLRGPLIVASALAAGLVLYMLPYWRNPGDSWRNEIAHETFSDDSWRSRWSGSDAWTRQDGRLVSKERGASQLTLRRRVSVPVAIEYTGQIQPGARPGDLSVLWSEGGPDDPVAGARTFAIQAGAYDNCYCGIFIQPGDQRLDHSNLRLESGRDYRFRVEIEGGRITMSIDGVKVLEHIDRFPSTSGFITLFGYYPGKAFDDVRVLGRPLRDQVPLSATGDSLYSFGHYDDAATVYGRLAQGGDVASSLVQDALFRQGMAQRRSGRIDDCNETWAQLSDAGLVQAAAALRLEDLLRTGQHELFLERLRDCWQRSPLAQRELRQQWSAAASAVAGARRIDPVFAEALLNLRLELFPTDTTTGYEAARVLFALERFEEVLRDFPDERRTGIAALVALGRFDEAERLPYAMEMDRVGIHYSRGDFAAVVEMTGPDSYQRAFAMCKMGRAGELRSAFSTHPAMLHLGHAEEMLKLTPVPAPNEVLLALGRFAEAAGEPLPGMPGSGRDQRALAILGRVAEAEAAAGEPLPWLRLIQAQESGDRDAAAAARAALRPSRSTQRPWFPTMVIGPFADHLQGRPEPLDQALRTMAAEWKTRHGRRAWLFARAVLGEAGEAEVIGMPAVLEGQAWWLVASALRAEREGRPADARQAYEAFVALPGRLRLLSENTLDGPVECLVRWRLRALAR